MRQSAHASPPQGTHTPLYPLSPVASITFIVYTHSTPSTVSSTVHEGYSVVMVTAFTTVPIRCGEHQPQDGSQANHPKPGPSKEALPEGLKRAEGHKRA